MENLRVVITQKGNPGVMQVLCEPLPKPKNNEVRIMVLSVGVAFGDILMRRGLYPSAPPPFVPGYDVIGIIDYIGNSVTAFNVGQRVAALTILGGYSKYICLDVDKITPVPHGVDTYKASALILNYLTAYQMLYRIAKVKPMDSILVHGASGGVGSAMLDLARGLNLKIYGTATINHQKKVSELANFIDYRNEDFVKRILSKEKEGIDFVFDGVGGYNWERSYQVLKKDGMFIGYGMTYTLDDNKDNQEQEYMQKEWSRILTSGMTSSNHRAEIFSITKMAQENASIIREDLEKLFNLLSENKINPTISSIFPLEKAQNAHEFFEQGVNGKVLLKCNE
ncbi:zinc-binding dehydrogenase [Cytobacillus suaedae]|nr:zinc-binding dehydrogenase [Cytobacillus suaedae]